MYRADKSLMRDPTTVNCRIYVGNIDESTTSDKLEDHFKKHGNILGIAVQRGFGFIQFEQENCAQEAIKQEHGVIFMGKKLNVKQAIDNTKKIGQQGPPQMQSASAPLNEPISQGPLKLGASLPPILDGPPRKMRRGGGGGVVRGVGRGGGMSMDCDGSPGPDDRDYRDGPLYYGRDDFPPNSGYIPPVVTDRNHGRSDRNDCEIIVVSKTLTEYAEYIEHRLKSIGLTVDLLFPNEDVPIGRVLANISSRGCLYAVLVMPVNEEHRSLTLNILHGIPQEHRNMPVDDAISLMARNFEAYMRGEKNGPPSKISIGPAALAAERHPEAVQILLNLLADNRQLTTLQYDRIIKYMQERREHQYKQEVGEVQEIAQNQEKETELQNRIMNILNKTGASPNKPPPVVTPTVTAPVQPQKNSAPILNDPSVQKALDSLLQGDILKNISTSRF